MRPSSGNPLGSAELARVGSSDRMGGSVQPSPTPDNPTPQMIPPPTHAVAGTIGEKHVLVMVRTPVHLKQEKNSESSRKSARHSSAITPFEHTREIVCSERACSTAGGITCKGKNAYGQATRALSRVLSWSPYEGVQRRVRCHSLQSPCLQPREITDLVLLSSLPATTSLFVLLQGVSPQARFLNSILGFLQPSLRKGEPNVSDGGLVACNCQSCRAQPETSPPNPLYRQRSSAPSSPTPPSGCGGRSCWEALPPLIFVSSSSMRPEFRVVLWPLLV